MSTTRKTERHGTPGPAFPELLVEIMFVART